MRNQIVRVVLLSLLLSPMLGLRRLAAEDAGAGRPQSGNTKVDALVAGSWNGILLVTGDASGFQVRVGARAEGGDFVDGDHVGGFLTGIEDLLAGKDGSKPRKHPPAPSANLPVFYESVTEVGPHAPDGSYARLVWNPLYPYDTGSRIRLEWARLDAGTVLGKVTYDAPTGSLNYMSHDRTADIVLEAYSPLGFRAKYRTDNQAVLATAESEPVTWEAEWDRWCFRFSNNSARLTHQEELGFRSGFWRKLVDDSKWETVRWGAYWQEGPTFIQQSGFGWYRTHFRLPARVKGQILRVDLGRVSQNDWTYLNGERIGNTSGAETRREYLVRPGTPAYEKIHWGGENYLAVQVQSTLDVGGISSGPFLKAVRLLPPPRPRIQAIAAARKNVNFVLVAGRRPDASGSYKEVQELGQQVNDNGGLGKADGSACAGLLFSDLHTGNKEGPADNQVYFVAKIGPGREASLLQAAKAILARPDLPLEIERRRIAYEASRVQAEGSLAGAAEMMTNTLHWNVLYAPEQKRAFVVDSRRWFLPDSWTLFGNSAILTAWAAAMENKQLAEDTFSGTMAEQLPDGKVMNAVGAMVTTPDRSQDMYAAYVAWKIYQKWGDKRFLREVYPRVKAWHEWWFEDRGDGQPWRDGNHDGLLELGSNLSPRDAAQAAPDTEEYGLHHQGAMWEAFDDSPMWGRYQKGISVHPPRYPGEDNVQYVFRTGTLNLNTAPTSALWALSADMLARIAHELNDEPGEKHFRMQYEQIKERINQTLWDEKSGMYLNRFWPEAGGNFSYRKSPALLWMMAAGIPSPAQAARLVHEHLVNPKEFWGDYVLPSISRDDPAFPEQYYWRGTIWPPLNFLVYEGLKRYGYDELAAELATKTYRLVKTNWDDTHALWENYNSITGEGNAHGAGGSTRHYAWSTALPLIAVMECIDQEAWGEGLRFGSIGIAESGRVRNLWIRGHVYDVAAGADLTELWQDGVRIFSADAGVVVRQFQQRPDHIGFNMKLPDSNEGAHITVGAGALKGKHVEVLVDGIHVPAASGGSDVVFGVSSGEHKVEITRTDVN